MDNDEVVRRMNEADEKYRDPIIEKFPNLRPETADWLADFVYDKVQEAREVDAPADPFMPSEEVRAALQNLFGNGTNNTPDEYFERRVVVRAWVRSWPDEA